MSEYSNPELQTATGSIDPSQLPLDQMPQVFRELTMLKGALDSVHRAAREIVQKTQPVQRQHPDPDPDSPQKLSEAFPVNTPLAEELRGLSMECSAIEMLLNQATYQIEL